jgi:hypothetical protein
VPINAEHRRSTPNDADALPALISDLLPALMRSRVLDAVLAAQAIAAGPVTSREARAARPVLLHARAFTEAARAVARLGPDERGRVLRCAGTDRKRFARWWVEETHAAGE